MKMYFSTALCVLSCIGSCVVVSSQALESDATVLTQDTQSRQNTIEPNHSVLKTPTFKFHDSERKTSANVYNPFLSSSPLDTLDAHASEATSSERDEKPLLRLLRPGRKPRTAKTNAAKEIGNFGLKKNSALLPPYKEEIRRKMSDIVKLDETPEDSTESLVRSNERLNKKQAQSSRDHYSSSQRRFEDFYKRKSTKSVDHSDSQPMKEYGDTESAIKHDYNVQIIGGSREKYGAMPVYDNTVPQFDNSRQYSNELSSDSTVKQVGGSREKDVMVPSYDNTVPQYDNSRQYSNDDSAVKQIVGSWDKDVMTPVYDNTVPQFENLWYTQNRVLHDGTVKQFGSSQEQDQTRFVYADTVQPQFDVSKGQGYGDSKEHDQSKFVYNNYVNQLGESQDNGNTRFVHDSAVKQVGNSREYDQTTFSQDNTKKQFDSQQGYDWTNHAHGHTVQQIGSSTGYDWTKNAHDNTLKLVGSFQNYDQNRFMFDNGGVIRPVTSQESGNRWGPVIQGDGKISNQVYQPSSSSMPALLSTGSFKNSVEQVSERSNFGENQSNTCLRSPQFSEQVCGPQSTGSNSVDSSLHAMNSESDLTCPINPSKEDFEADQPTQKFQRSSFFIPFCPEVHNITEIYWELCKDNDCDEEFFEELQKMIWTGDVLKVPGLKRPPLPPQDSLPKVAPNVPAITEFKPMFTPEFNKIPEIKAPSFVTSNKLDFGSFEKSKNPSSYPEQDIITTLENANLKIKSIGPANRGTVQQLGPNSFACLHGKGGPAPKTISNVVDNAINFVDVSARLQPTQQRDVSGWSQQKEPVKIMSSDLSSLSEAVVSEKPETSFKPSQILKANSAGFLNYPFSDPKPLPVERIPSTQLSPDNGLGQVWDNCNNIINRKPKIEDLQKPLIHGPPKPDTGLIDGPPASSFGGLSNPWIGPPKPDPSNLPKPLYDNPPKLDSDSLPKPLFDSPSKPDSDSLTKPYFDSPPKPEVKKPKKKSKKKSSDQSGSKEPEIFEEAVPEWNEIISKTVMKGKPDDTGNGILLCMDETGSDGKEDENSSSESVDVEVHIIRYNCSYRDTPENKRNLGIDIKDLHKGETWPHLTHLKLIPLSEEIAEAFEEAAESNEVQEMLKAKQKEEAEAINKALDPNQKSTS